MLTQASVEHCEEGPGICAADHQADEPDPPQCHHFPKQIGEVVLAVDVAEVDAAVGLDLRANGFVLGLQLGELFRGQFREGNLGHRKRSPCAEGRPDKVVRLKPNRL